jgi:hypothetical protein
MPERGPSSQKTSNLVSLFVSINNAAQAMPPRPFPFPISVGTDICSIPRIQGLLVKDRNSGRKLCRKLLSDKEFRLHWPRIGGRLREWHKDVKIYHEDREIPRKHLLAPFRTKRKQLGIDPKTINEMISPESTTIKEGTNGEPMRTTDSHILKIILNLISYPLVREPSLVRSSTMELEHDAEFVAGRYVGPSIHPSWLYFIVKLLILLSTGGLQKKPSSRHTTLVD